jgi:hypothetical protein
MGSDEIHIKFIKLFKFAFLTNLVLIMNLSITRQFVPTACQISRICPLFKSGSKSIINNYRPIALTSVFGKILEKHICKILSDFLNHNKLLSKQFGFKELN